ncbi:uncharacterized protein SPAPADRAFT_63257 [Spathaspora passalidarum NRRL Y-27907]|uniref:CID domain-containing protein n=1 Tax=Spathaspora passalidarum (strain NRRL Y-27907 / 11-Y1) TaxID=619300 RepID=G3AU32_SPAPN|nr:uncharacterized protein SPAPADRAFT_63257 [Spathaspora passalidarum NRRL Y-27907]EGW30407.1 hypothetical protein SPAPADRAFT_63257 [Spathaspora passalidarum NRRL Y-27907]
MSDILESYQQTLSELTFNSRPIIETLTTIAKENPTVADGIIDLITQRIRRAIPQHKLFALYLLDSICKTVGNPYNILVGYDVYNLFIDVWKVVDEATRTRLVALFETWKISKVRGGGESLFPRDQLDKVEGFLKKVGKLTSAPTQSQSQKSQSGPVLSNSKLISDINQLIPIFEAKLKRTNDSKLNDKFRALNQLKIILTNQQMKPQELQAVQNQLNAIKEQELSPAPPSLPPIPPKPVIHQQHQQQQQQPPQPLQPIVNASQIFNDLILSGLVKKEQEPIPGSKPNYTLVFPTIKYVPKTEIPGVDVLADILNPNSNIQRSEYQKLKFGELVQISKAISGDDNSLQKFINTNKPSHSSVQLLYNSKASKCSICGKRFSTDQEGSTKKRLHLDWHFRINKKLTGTGSGATGTGGGVVSNVQSRSWYLDDYDWANFKDEQLLEFATPEVAQTATINSNIPSGVVPYVVVPSADTNMNNKCLICLEQVKASYNDEIGEWCWMGCIKSPNDSKNLRKIVHITCFNDRKRATDTEDGNTRKRGKLA